jgi:predicted permease
MMRRLFLKLFRRRSLDRDLEAELTFHREMAAAAGNPIPLGNTAFIREQAFDLWRFNRVENLWRDLVYAVRGLRRSPGFVLAALLSLGLGIGINTAMFSLAVEFLLSQPSVRDAASVVYVRQGGNSHTQPAVIDALRRGGVFEDVVGENEESFINFNDGAQTRRVFAVQATGNYFTALGIPVARGRGWNETDPKEVVVLHPHFWRTRLGGDPAIVGKAIRLDGRLYTVLGILPDDYRSLIGYGFAPDVLVPRYMEGTILAAYARIKPGMSLGQLKAALPALDQQVERESPSMSESEKFLSATPVGGLAALTSQKETLTLALFFLILLILVGLVLLIACVNVAGLLLARASVRRQEIAIRLALGASRGRLLQQLLAESLLLSLAGAALGFLLALGGAKAAAAVPLPVPFPVRLQIQPDWRVASYAALMAVLSAIASGLVPAWQSLRESFAAGMHRERRLGMRRALVVAQIAVSFLVLTTAALFLDNLLRSSSLGPGFDIRHTFRAEVYLPPSAYKSAHDINPYVDRALERLRAVPGVDSAAAARIVPFTDATNFDVSLTFAGGGEKQQARFNWNAVSPDYFRAMDIPLLAGRPFTAHDDGGGKVVIINQEFVRRYLGTRQPIGAAFRWEKEQPPFRIVGVVAGTKNMTIGEDPRAQVYEPLAQIVNDRQRLQFVVRSALPPATQLTAIRAALREAEPAAGLEVETMFSAIGFAFLPSRVGAALMGSIGALGLLLAVIGLYGVLAYSVARRTREIGIRMAIGASAGHVSRMVMGEFVRLLAAGIAIGLAMALAVTRPLAMFFVPGLSPWDPASFAAVILLLGLTGFLASLGPLRRALRVDPLGCLRYE